jgi:hypothetical protein
MNEQELSAYTAGFVDGEGHIGNYITYRCKKSDKVCRQLKIETIQKNPEVLFWLKKSWDMGFITKGAFGCKRWIVTGKEASIILKKIYPYLIVKKEQVDNIYHQFMNPGDLFLG